MKLLLFSDLHLDAHFAWAKPAVARSRRQRLRDTLDAIVARARALEVDALLCGGDLYEHDRYSPDTVAFVRSSFEQLHPMPVYIAPGNHEPFQPQRPRV